MKNKHYYRRAFRMAWPAVLESFFIALAAVIDTMMVGALGPEAIAAVGLTTQPKLIGLTLFFAINVALSATIARRKGQANKYGANQVFMTSLLITIIACLVITGLLLVYAYDIINLAGSKADTHLPAVQYFQIIMGGMIFNVVAMTINAGQRAAGNTRIAFVTNLTSSIVNVIFNYLLITGKFGFPALGVQGAALATVLGTVVAMFMSLRSLFKPESLIQLPYIRKYKIYFDKKSAFTILKLAGNLLVENLAMRVGFLATALTAASLGTHDFAVHNAGMNLLMIGFSFGEGMQVATVTLTGQALGQGHKEEAITWGKVSQRLGLMISIALSICLFAFGRQIMSIYFQDANLIDNGIMITRFIMVIALIQISQMVYGGCLRSGGDVRYTLFVGFTAVGVVRTLVTQIMVQLLHLGLIGIWIGVLADQFTRFSLIFLRFKQEKWTQIAI